LGQKLDKLTIRGFKSIERLEDFELGDMNILIGANGSGKSNFVEFFRLLREMVEQRLDAYIAKHQPADGYFFDGVDVTAEIEIAMRFGAHTYAFMLSPTSDDTLYMSNERIVVHGDAGDTDHSLGSGDESHLRDRKDEAGLTPNSNPIGEVWEALSNWHVYHFHDTGFSAGMRRSGGIEQTGKLHPEGDNLAAFLLGLRESQRDTYNCIRKTIQRVAPFFDDFVLSVRKNTVEDQVRLTWRQKGTDYVFSPGHFSDGTIRFICLATALLQPTPPSTVVIDEPELGLHPEALSILAGLMRSAASRTQIIAATQSPVLLSEFDPGDVITVDRVNGATCFHRLDPQALQTWLEDFSLGELWIKGNVRGGVNDA
jgi:predicted ATPase